MLKCNELLILAERDRKVCRLVERDFPEPYAVSAVAFHMQQAIEKLLKGLILMYGEEPACTYSITKLIDHCQRLDIEIPEELDDISDTLTLWETNSRYDPYMDFSQKKYDKAKKMYDHLYEKLSNELDAIQETDETESQGFNMTL